MCERHGAVVATIEKDWGCVFTDEEVEAAVLKEKPNLLFIVHACTSTGALQPLKGIGALCQRENVLFCVDTVTSIGGVELRVDEWGIDACYAGTQKCLNCPPGLGPISFSQRARDKMNQKEKGRNWYLDLRSIEKYLVPQPGVKRAYHHTAPISMILALHEALRVVQAEGLENRWKRHQETSEYLWAKCESIGLKLHV